MSKSARYWLLALPAVFLLSLFAARVTGDAASAQPGDSQTDIKGWKKGIGWGWIWGQDDEVGALNAMSPATVRGSLGLVTHGKVYDLGVPYNRNSYKWPGHSPCEVLTFRGPEGVKRQLDHEFIEPDVNPVGTGWHSCALFISDNVGTQIDGLAHITAGDDNHWYNGYREADWGGNFGVRKCDAASIPPIVARGVMLDIAGLKGIEALPPQYAITPADVDRALKRQNVDLRPGDVVLFRTGVLRFWGRDGADHETIQAYDSAGISLETARYLVEEFGSMMIGSDTSGLEVQPPPQPAGTFIPVHNYLLIEQGVHIAEFHNLEELARDGVSEFCYMATTNNISGTTAGFAMRPIAIR